MKADQKMKVEARDKKKNFVIIKGPNLGKRCWFKPMRIGAVQATLNRLSLPIIAFTGVKILGGLAV